MFFLLNFLYKYTRARHNSINNLSKKRTFLYNLIIDTRGISKKHSSKKIITQLFFDLNLECITDSNENFDWKKWLFFVFFSSLKLKKQNRRHESFLGQFCKVRHCEKKAFIFLFYQKVLSLVRTKSSRTFGTPLRFFFCYQKLLFTVISTWKKLYNYFLNVFKFLNALHIILFSRFSWKECA